MQDIQLSFSEKEVPVYVGSDKPIVKKENMQIGFMDQMEWGI